MKTYTEAELKALEQRIICGLAVPADNGVWDAVMAALEYEQHQACLSAIAPDLTNEARQYNCGGAGRLVDFEQFLREKFRQAHVPKEK